MQSLAYLRLLVFLGISWYFLPTVPLGALCCARSITALLPALASTSGPVASWQIRELRSFFHGAFRGLHDLGVDTSADDERMRDYDHWVRQRFSLSGRWDRVI